MRRGLTLIELLTVIGMMSVLGCLSVVAGVSVTRGLNDRAATRAVAEFLGVAQRRATVEGVGTEVVFQRYELPATADEESVDCCRALACRRAGRISRIIDGYPWDEFADGGEIRLDEAPDVLLPAGDLAVGAAYGRVFARLELPPGYTAEPTRIRFVPVPGALAQMEGSVSLTACRPDGRKVSLGGVNAATTEEVRP